VAAVRPRVHARVLRRRPAILDAQLAHAALEEGRQVAVARDAGNDGGVRLLLQPHGERGGAAHDRDLLGELHGEPRAHHGLGGHETGRERGAEGPLELRALGPREPVGHPAPAAVHGDARRVGRREPLRDRALQPRRTAVGDDDRVVQRELA
jgi:hypothetical protein